MVLRALRDVIMCLDRLSGGDRRSTRQRPTWAYTGCDKVGD